MGKKKILSLAAVVVLLLIALPGLKIIADAIKKEKAYQFTVNGQKWFIVADKSSLEKMLNQYQQRYLSNIDQNAKIKKVTFVQKVEIIEVEVRPEQIDSLAKAKQRIFAVQKEAVEIEIRKGDNYWNLSKEHHLSVNELEILNPDVDPDKLYPGEKLVVKPLDPKLDVKVELENTIVESIPFNNEYRKNNNLYQNQKQTIRRGIEGEKQVNYRITMLNGYQSSLKVQNEQILKEPVNAIIHIGTKKTVARGGRINYGVVSGKRISSRYGTRVHPITGRRRFHEGLDIADNSGNGVYAYSNGRVVQAGWNGGYGKAILIDHGNGLKTRYAHLSKISVKVGQKVGTGDRIGAVGSTGNSTGPHLHFEVIKNGRTENPLNYI